MLNSLHIAVTASSLLLFFISIFCLLFLKSGSCSQETHIRNKDRERHDKLCLVEFVTTLEKPSPSPSTLPSNLLTPSQKMRVQRDLTHPSIHSIPWHPMFVCLSIFRVGTIALRLSRLTSWKALLFFSTHWKNKSNKNRNLLSC